MFFRISANAKFTDMWDCAGVAAALVTNVAAAAACKQINMNDCAIILFYMVLKDVYFEQSLLSPGLLQSCTFSSFGRIAPVQTCAFLGIYIKNNIGKISKNAVTVNHEMRMQL